MKVLEGRWGKGFPDFIGIGKEGIEKKKRDGGVGGLKVTKGPFLQMREGGRKMWVGWRKRWKDLSPPPPPPPFHREEKGGGGGRTKEEE